MEPNPEATPATSEIDARALFASKLAAIAVGKPEAEDISVKKRGVFLTRSLFGLRNKEGAVEAERSVHGTETCDPEPLPGAVSILQEQTPAAGETPLFTNVGENVSAQEIYSLSPATTDFPEPRITVPSFSSPPTTTMPIPFTGGATAQLTLGFEITSLQLTPFFRLGSLQLKALSNVVSLSLAAAQQASQPLAVGVSFEIAQVELDGAAHLKSLGLKPLGEPREMVSPVPRLQVDAVTIAAATDGAPIAVTTSDTASTAVQLVGTFAIAALEFSAAFEIDLVRLKPASDTVWLRVAPSSDPSARNMPPTFGIAEVQLDGSGQICGARLVPGLAANA